MTFGAYLRAERLRHKWTLTDLAHHASVSRSYLYQIETDASSPTLRTLEAFAGAFDVSVSDLLAPLYHRDEPPFPLTAPQGATP